MTDVATMDQLLRIIQSIPPPKAEPYKLWLAEIGREHIEETIDTEQATGMVKGVVSRKDRNKE